MRVAESALLGGILCAYALPDLCGGRGSSALLKSLPQRAASVTGGGRFEHACDTLRLRGGFDVAGAQAGFVRETMQVSARGHRVHYHFMKRMLAHDLGAPIQVPAERIGIIIGRQGATIKEIGRQSGTNVWVDPKVILYLWSCICAHGQA